eukprot:scaffold64326_cov59-Phaeocystis_antarctica.AAC.5
MSSTPPFLQQRARSVPVTNVGWFGARRFSPPAPRRNHAVALAGRPASRGTSTGELLLLCLSAAGGGTRAGQARRVQRGGVAAPGRQGSRIDIAFVPGL